MAVMTMSEGHNRSLVAPPKQHGILGGNSRLPGTKQSGMAMVVHDEGAPQAQDTVAAMEWACQGCHDDKVVCGDEAAGQRGVTGPCSTREGDRKQGCLREHHGSSAAACAGQVVGQRGITCPCGTMDGDKSKGASESTAAMAQQHLQGSGQHKRSLHHQWK